MTWRPRSAFRATRSWAARRRSPQRWTSSPGRAWSTLTGPGGIGKTRLALHTAAAVAERFPGGVLLCELAPVGRPAAVVGAVASTFGIDDRTGRDLSARIVEYLRGPSALLVLDNCEHVLDGVAALVEAVLSRTPDVVVLATSRRRLGVTGEHVLAVDALDVGAAAMELFLDRRPTCVPARRHRATSSLPSPTSAGCSTVCPWRSSWRRRGR